MQIQYIAHATFTIDLNDGRRIIIDPYLGMSFQGRFNYPPYPTQADFAVITHDHLDHNYLGDIRNIPVVVRNNWHDDRLDIRSITVFHDKFGGTKFGGTVNMKIIQADGIRLCHMGDCGEILSDEQIQAIGDIDILLIPVGGFYTIDGDEAADLANRIHAKTTIPCHYITPRCSLKLEGPEKFLARYEHFKRLNDSKFNAESLPDGVVFVPSLY